MTVQTQATARWTWIVRLAVAMVLALAGVGSAMQEAQADTTLCQGNSFSTCINKGYTAHGYESHYVSSYWRAAAGHNCTNYVGYMLWKNGDPGHNVLMGDGGSWDDTIKANPGWHYTINGTPAVGSIAQWNPYADGGSWIGSSGHVAYVEKVSASSITISEDNASSGPFRWRTISVGSVEWPSNFLHIKDVSSNFQPFAGDFNGDGIGDIGFRRVDTGKFYLRYGPSFTGQTVYDWSDGPGFQPFVTDVNGDGKDDIGIRNIATGVYYIRESPSFMTQVTYHWSVGTNYEPIGGDFNGDGIGDIGIRNIATGKFYLRYGPSFASSQSTYDWSDGSGFQPFVTDINGDGKDDLGIRKISTGTYYIRHSPSFTDQTVSDWSDGPGFQPFAGDFNGDGIGDIGIRNISTGKWYIRYGPAFTSQTTYQWSHG